MDLREEAAGLTMVLCWLATADAAGRPNVSPKELYEIRGSDRLLIADIASARSVRNVTANPRVCVALLDVFRQRGLRVAGEAEVVPPDGAAFAELAAGLLERARPKFEIRNLIVVRAASVSRLLAPSRQFYPETAAEDLMADSWRSYRVEEVAERLRAHRPNGPTQAPPKPSRIKS
jgi:hypothetical protein